METRYTPHRSIVRSKVNTPLGFPTNIQTQPKGFLLQKKPPMTPKETKKVTIDVTEEPTQELPEVPILEDSSDEDSDIDSTMDDMAQKAIIDWLSEYGPKLFEIASQRFLTKQEKKRKAESSETLPKQPLSKKPKKILS